MKDVLAQVWAKLKEWSWVIAGVGLVVVAWVFLAPRGRKPQSKEDLLRLPPESNVDSLRQVAVLEAEKAKTDALIARAKRDTKIEIERQKLDKIKKEPNPTVKRKKLAAWAEQNL
jgi:hypothetical protein